MSYLFTSESVSEGHPDKVADQISDALIDNFLAFDPESKVACETLVTTGQVVLAGEVCGKKITMKRFRPRAKGRAAPILKPYSSVTIILSETKKMESHGSKS